MSPNLDMRVRLAAFQWLAAQMEVHGETLPRSVLAQGFEFSGGLFSNLNIETTREDAKVAQASGAAPAAAAEDANAVKPEVVVFTVKANFASSKTQQSQTPAPAAANQVAMKK